jgi:transketolase
LKSEFNPNYEPEASLSPAQMDALCVNTLRFLAVDAVQKADSGHPGLPLGAAPMAYVLWSRFLKAHPSDPSWFDRDRFVLSAGHGSALLYSMLHLFGYNLSLDQLINFRQWGSLTPGHPERNPAIGIETTTGPLGQGFANGVGMAIAEAHLAARYNRPSLEIVDHYTYALVSDGDLMEGVAAEAASLAGHLKLGKLIYLYDANRMSLAASTDLTFTENVGVRFEAYNWHVQSLPDGNDLEAIDRALQTAKAETDRPSLIIVRTRLGYGSPHKQDTFEAHGSPLGEEEVKLTKQALGWPLEPPFLVPPAARDHAGILQLRGKRAQDDWNQRWVAYQKSFPQLSAELQAIMADQLPPGWNQSLPQFPADPKGISTRVASGKILTSLASHIPQLIGGSADLNPSTLTTLKNLGDFESPAQRIGDSQGSAGGGLTYAGRNLHFGVREHAMGSILNGLACHGGMIPFGATFLTFSDYMRPPLRLAALMGVQVIYVFTHDSLALGQDGPTHQAVEQVAGLRSVPNLVVIRPADAQETSIAWQVAVETRDRPTALILTRQNLPILDRTKFASAEGLRQGGYILAEPDRKLDIILIATGSEVSLIVEAQARLKAQGVGARLVSLPSWELFQAQSEDYRQKVLPADVKARLAVEAGSPLGWREYVGDQGDVIGVDRFGASAPGELVMREYGFTVENVVARALKLLNRKT